MDRIHTRILVISHAGVKRINRAVYALLRKYVTDIRIIVPAQLVLKSSNIIRPDPPSNGEAEIIPMDLEGSNPRKYFYPGLIHCLEKFKPDVVLLENDPVSKLGVQLAGWCNRTGSKLICQTYDNTPRNIVATAKAQGLKAIPKNLLIHLMNFYMASKVQALLLVNRESVGIFTQYRYRNIVQIPLGYDKSVFYLDQNLRAAYRKKLNLATDTVLVAYFGRLVKQKGVHLLIKALSQLKQQNWRLLLDHNHDGEDQYSSYIRDLIFDLNLTERVIYFEADHYEIANYMRASDIMVAPSITTATFKEQYGRAVQEAMACGCLCLVSDSGHLKDLVGNNDLVFKEGDIGRLQALLDQFIANDEKRRNTSYILSERAQEKLTVECQSMLLHETIVNLTDN